VVAVAVLSASVGAQPNAVRAYRIEHEADILREFIAFLALPNVASDSAGIRRNADALSAMMERRGLHPRLLRASAPSAPPAVFGELTTPGARTTLLFYAHYDGQPTNPSTWTGSAPWAPVFRSASLEKGGRTVEPRSLAGLDPETRIYARSASDDKAGVVAILYAVDALRASGITLPVNLKFLFEGEEEAGSPHLSDILRRNRDLLRSDAWIICDGPVHQSGVKQVVFGVRGVTTVDVTVYGATRPLHSGHYGNWAPNPAMILSKLLASMKDATGRVTIPGWYADVAPLGQLERQALREAPPFDDSLRAQLGFARAEGGGRSLMQLINQPALNVVGLSSADVGPAARNIIPTTATATLDVRLVKGTDYRKQADLIGRHARAQGFHVVTTEPSPEDRRRYPLIAKIVRRDGGYNAERTEMDLPVSRAALAAIRSLFPRAIAMPTLGGSLPLSIVRESLGVPTITVPIANYDNNQHAENENIRLQNLWDGIEMIAALMIVGLQPH
jgi:acetylornithine deacetylase/succinyl-diaminopimelate desuccinylase-like protein